jgi:general secretion pathway protein N
MKRAVLWLLAVALSVAATLLVFLPATWMAAIVERQTAGRITLGDAEGSLWNGSAFVGGAASAGSAVTPLLPGRFAWRLSPLVLLGVVDLRFENAEALTQPVELSGSWSAWSLSPAALRLPAEGLSGLGAPLNTLAPSGALQLGWSTLQLARTPDKRGVDLSGKTTLTMTDMSSRLSALRPLGSYEMVMDWHGQEAQLTLRSIKGPLLLDGAGGLTQGRFRFSGHAQAAQGYEETLASLLNLLGQRRMYNGKNIIALEFR